MFGIFKRKKTVENNIISKELEYKNKPIALNLSKDESLNLLYLRKDMVSNMCNNIPDLKDMKSRVALVLDFSASMRPIFNDGTVQAVIERIMPIAHQFDDDGELDFWIFENGFKRMETININNFYGIAKKILAENRMGDTKYAPVMQDVLKKYTEEDRCYLPAYIFFITDGDNFDKSATERVIVDTCEEPVFWQFIGLGDDSMDFLENLDDMKGRKVDSVDFFRLNRPNHVTDETLYAKCFDEYPKWIQDARKRGIVK